MFHFLVFRQLNPVTSQQKAMKNYVSVLLTILMVLLPSGTVYSKDTSLIKTHIEVALIRTAFIGSNENDAAAAFITLAKTLGEQKGYDMEISVSIYKNADEIAALPEKKRPHIALLGSWSFLQLEKEGWLTPITVASIGNAKACDTLKILVSENSTVNTIEDLQGKNINVLFMPQTQILFPWLHSLLKERSLGTPKSFFKSINTKNLALQAVLPVFFDKEDADAVVIPSERFKLMAERNPQLNKMRTIAVSKPLVCGITSFNNQKWNNDSKVKKDIVDAMLKLHVSPAGQQMLHLFKGDQIFPYRPEYLETVRALARILSTTKHSSHQKDKKDS